MTKYSIILMSGEVDSFLSDLQNLGLVDVTRKQKPFDKDSGEKFVQIQQYNKICKALKGHADPEGNVPAATLASAAEVLRSAESKLEELKELEISLKDCRTLAKRAAVWGEFNSADIDRLDQLGFIPRFYHLKNKKFDESLLAEYPCEVIARDDDSVYLIALQTKGESFDFPYSECDFPAKSAQAYEEDAKMLEQDIEAARRELASLAACTPLLEDEQQKLAEQLDLYFASNSTRKEAEDVLSIIEGFAPTDADETVKAFLDSAPVVYLSGKATVEDNPPIKLRNNKFSKMFEVLTGMYGMPDYNEFDPTPILGPFFLLFFAMCMGDAGYGILLILIGILLGRSKMGMSKLGPLVTTLGVATLIIGFFLGTFFGIDLYKAAWFPESLKGLIFHDQIMGYDVKMVLALGIGVFHIILAMIIKGIVYTQAYGFRQAVSTWGWVLLIIGGIVIAALSLLKVMPSEVTKWAIIVVGVISALGIFIFNTPGRNPLLNVGAGLWDTYNKVTGILGDVLSYIRLYALGLAGGMLGGAFNDLGMMAFNGMPVPGVNYLVLILILAIGHALNLAMSCLGAFVHPLRLTFVEYFKNSGYEGKGKLYKPLTVKKQ
ncbi:MAG: ATPase V [Bacteroidales bacterium]|nr:ATPase V [Bacteroidales bacterium]MBO7479565.1 ATPase V [Bacteroidales bacterium]